jgi:SAM-dependent methyltransferase
MIMKDAETVIKQAFERPDWYVTRSAYNIRLRIETIRDFIGNDEPETILDIGCGDGSLSLHLLTANNRLTLLDRSKRMLELARSRISQGLANHVAIMNEDFMSAHFRDGNFDLIICIGVMAYVDDRRNFVRKILSLLRPGGTLIMECSDGGHWISRVNRIYDSVRIRLGGAEFPTILRPASELVAILSDFGFEPCRTFRYSLPPLSLGKLLSQRASYKTIRRLFGTALHNRAGWLGSECIFHFRPRAEPYEADQPGIALIGRADAKPMVGRA